MGQHIFKLGVSLSVFAIILPNAVADRSDTLFPTDRLIEVEVIMAPGDWDAMRREHHDLFTGTAPESGPRPSPYNYYKGTVIIEGERVEHVGIRKKGFLGSASAHRPSLKFNFGKFNKGREFRDLELMTLNNNDQDASQLKQYLAYKLFNEAGVESPRCSLARVTVNGKYLGVYSHVESVNKQFVKRRFTSSKGNLYEGQIADFREGFSNKFEKKTNKKKANFRDIEAVRIALETDNDNLLVTLDEVVNVDQYVRYWAMESLVGHRDSYSGNLNNFLVYHEPESDQFNFIPWGTDGAFEWRETKYSVFKRPDYVKAEGYIAHRLYKHPDGQKMYRDRMRANLEDIWKEEELLTEMDRMKNIVQPHIHLPVDVFEEEIAKLETFITGRREMFEAELHGPIPEWKLPLREPRTAESEPLGTMKGSFSTTWVAGQNGTESQGSIAVTIDGFTRNFTGTRIGASRTRGSFRAGYPMVYLSATEEGTDRGMSFYLIIDPDFFGPDQEQPVDGYTVFSQLRQITGNPPVATRLGYLVGTMKLQSAGTNDGDSVTGTIEARISGRAKPADWKE